MDLSGWDNRKRLVKKDKCFGCMACFNICSKKAIQIQRDKFGAIYTEIDTDKCIKCGSCVKVCPALTKIEKKIPFTPTLYAAVSKDEDERWYSTSGGVFPILAKKIMQEGGKVAGVSYSRGFQTKNLLVSNEIELRNIMQSKYVQSTPGTIYKHIKYELDQGKKILFSGTPCQIVALNLFLGKEKHYSNLVTCEIVCIGVPQPDIFRSYLQILSRKFKSIPTKVWFKYKAYGWDSLTTRIEFKNGAIYEATKDSDLFMTGFRKHNFFVRPSCFKCPYKGINRYADITLGDFWGLKNTKFNDNKGTSLVILNSPKGEKLFEECKIELYYEKRLLKEALRNQGLTMNLLEDANVKLFRFLYRRLPLEFIMWLSNKFL